ncbi:MAG: hypothetical protein J0G30_07330 [Actinomycetales bacterium]|nr:hypothetical protein [Actinomycetales bacterium]
MDAHERGDALAGPLAELRALLADAARSLQHAGARSELRADLVRGPALLGRRARLVRRGRIWRLGVVLLAPSGEVFAGGTVVTGAPLGHPNFRSAIALERRELQVAARRGRIPPDEVVTVGARPVALDPAAFAADPGPFVVTGDGLGVRWSPAADPVAAGPYLAERVALLLDPPEGA